MSDVEIKIVTTSKSPQKIIYATLFHVKNLTFPILCVHLNWVLIIFSLKTDTLSYRTLG